MKVKSINHVVVIIILLLEVNFFSLFDMPSSFEMINSYRNKYLIILISIVWLIFYILLSSHNKHKQYFNATIMIFMFSVIFIQIASCFIYEQSLTGMIKASYFYFAILMFYPLTKFLLSSDENYRFFVNYIIWFGVIYSVLLFIEYIGLYNGLWSFMHFGINIISDSSIEYRIARPASFIAFSSLFLFADIISNDKKNKVMKIIFFILELYCLINICKTRIYVVAIFVVVIYVVFILKNKNLSDKRKIINFVIALVLVCGMLFLIKDNIGEFYRSFFEGNRASSMNTRIREFDYFSKQIFDNKVFGRGFIDNLSVDYSSLIYGPYKEYYSSDIGVVGFLSIFGFLGIWFIFSLVKRYNKVIKIGGFSKTFVNSYYYNIIYMMRIFLAVISITIVYTINNCIIYLPIVFSLLEVSNSKINNKKEER